MVMKMLWLDTVDSRRSISAPFTMVKEELGGGTVEAVEKCFRWVDEKHKMGPSKRRICSAILNSRGDRIEYRP